MIMEKRLNCSLMLSLQEMALRRVVVNFWIEPDILDSIVKFSKTLNLVNWCKTFENKVKDKILDATLPETLMNQMFYIVKPIGLQILKWKRFHERYLKIGCFSGTFLTVSPAEFDVYVLETLHWTSAGAVDYRKTAEQLILSNLVDVMTGYRLARLYCLEDYIPVLRNEIRLEAILRGEEFKFDNLNVSEPSSFNRFSLKYLTFQDNKAAAEYFISASAGEVGECNLVQTANFIVGLQLTDASFFHSSFPEEKFSGLLCYILSLMDREQQMQFFKICPHRFFLCFLLWPWNDLFHEVLAFVWDFMPVSSLVHQLQKCIVDLGYYFPLKIFKTIFVHQLQKYNALLPVFFRMHHKALETILRNLSEKDTVEFMFSDHVYKMLYASIIKEIPQVIEVCFLEANFSTQNYKKFQSAFTKFLRGTGENLKFRCPNWKRFSDLFLDKKSASRKRTLDEAKFSCKVRFPRRQFF